MRGKIQVRKRGWHAIKHGLANSPEYNAFTGARAKARKRSWPFPYLNFPEFFAAAGPRPTKKHWFDKRKLCWTLNGVEGHHRHGLTSTFLYTTYCSAKERAAHLGKHFPFADVHDFIRRVGPRPSKKHVLKSDTWRWGLRGTHQMCRTPEYWSFMDAKHRCQNPNAQGWKNYGGRGIEFRFNTFEEFYEHVGPRLSNEHSLDRIDVNGHYEKGNLRWTTLDVQLANRRCSHRHEPGDVEPLDELDQVF